jgi:hypothetical protein
MINAKEKEQTYKTVPEGTYYYGLTLIDGDVYRVLMWNDLLSIEGTDRIVTMTFRLFDVTIKGSGLLQLIRDAKRHRIDVLAVSPRNQTMLGGEGVIVTDLFVKAAQT